MPLVGHFMCGKTSADTSSMASDVASDTVCVQNCTGLGFPSQIRLQLLQATVYFVQGNQKAKTC